MKVLEDLATKDGPKSAASTRMAVIDYQRKGTADGNKVIDEVLQRDPKNVPALLTKARFLLAEKKLDEALERAKAAVAADPRSIQAHYLQGAIHRAARTSATRPWPRSTKC